jgi:cytochrome c2
MTRRSRGLAVLLALAGLGLVLLSAPPSPVKAEGGQGTDPAGMSQGASSADGGQGMSPAGGDLVGFGRALFQAKGCTACHQHQEVNPGAGVSVGPDLTKRVFEPDFLRAWLSDPASIRPGTLMPNLALSPDEIEALIAFLNDDPS